MVAVVLVLRFHSRLYNNTIERKMSQMYYYLQVLSLIEGNGEMTDSGKPDSERLS